MRPSRWALIALLALGLEVLQVTLLDRLEIAGMHPEAIWVLPVAAGLVAGPNAGMISGFIGGVIADALLPAPFGLTALICVVIGFVVGRLGEEGVGDLGGAAFFVAPMIAAGAGAIAPVAYALVGTLMGHHHWISANLLVLVVLDALICALLVRPVMRVCSYFLDDPSRTAPLDPVRGMA